MAVTRINNNQISDAINGNVYVGINAAVKLQNYSVTATKIANNLTYGSDLTITGNLTVQGNTTTIDTTYTTIEDPILLLASNQTGSPTVDIGFVGERGTSNNIAFVWDESASEFVTVYTTTGETNTTVSIASYADIHSGNANIGSNLVVNGTSSFVGNLIGNVNVTANVAVGNILTNGLVSATGNVTGGNINTGGVVSAAGNVNAAGAVFSGNVTASYFFGNIAGNIDAAGSNTQVQFNNDDLLGGSSNFTFDTATNILAVTGAIQGTTVSATGNVTGGNLVTGGLITATGNISSGANIVATANVIGGNLTTAGLITATGNITGGNVSTGIMSASGNVTGSNLITGGLITATGNVTGGNIVTGGLITATGNINGANINTAQVASTGGITITSGGSSDIILSAAGNIDAQNNYINNLNSPVQDNDAASKIYVDNLVATGLTYHESVFVSTIANLATTTGGTITYAQPNGAGNGIGATITTTGSFNLIDTGNVQTAGTRILVKDEGNAVINGVYTWSNATVITRSTDADEYGIDSAQALSLNSYFFTESGNVNKGSAFVVAEPSGAITFGSSNIVFDLFSTSQVYSANVQAGLVLVGTVFSAKVDNDTTAFDGSGNIIVKAGANLTTPNIGAATGTSLSVSGNVTGGNLNTGGAVSATGNVTSGNVNTGIVSATGNVIGSGAVFSGNVTAANFIGNISGNIDAGGANTNIQFNDGDILAGSSAFTFDKTTNAVVATGNVTAGNVLTGGLIDATGNITGGNLITAGLATVTGNVIGGNINTAGQVVATGNVNGGNVVAVALVSGANVTATSNVTGANIVGTTSGTFANIRISSSSIDSDDTRITINGADADVDFAVDGDTTANVFYVDAGTGTASFGSSTQTTNAIVAFNATNSILMPVGNTAQRPGTGVTGMLRFNSTLDAVEVYDTDSWTTVGTPSFTVVTDDQFTGNGVQVAYTLANAYTTNSVIVSINGVIQIPTSAYSVSGNALTFTEAPQQGDFIDVRGLTTTTQVVSISNSPGNAVVATNPTVNEVNITGNLLPVANNTQSLGSQTLRWKDLYVAGNSIYIGNIVMKNTSGNTVAFYGPDGSTPATIDSTNVDTTTIASGTSNVRVQTSGGNIAVGVDGSNIVRFTTAGIVNDMGNGVGNIGNATGYFNTAFVKATSAQYADLAENYTADAHYEPGTVLSFGGTHEVTVSATACDARIAGIVSTNPSYIMNSTLDSKHVATVALTGRVPTKVSGPVAKGDMMISAGDGRAVACATPAIGTVIGKALENHPGGDGVIEVVVGRL